MSEHERARRRRQTGAAAAAHTAEQERLRAVEAQQAGELVAWFAVEAHRRGLHTTALVARAYGGRARYRTGLRGWYIHRNRQYAVGADGHLYQLDVAASFRARFTGVTLVPHTPVLVIGRGGRDGEAVGLRLLLERRLAAGDDWP